MPGNYVSIVNLVSDLCLDVAGRLGSNGANVVQFPATAA